MTCLLHTNPNKVPYCVGRADDRREVSIGPQLEREFEGTHDFSIGLNDVVIDVNVCATTWISFFVLLSYICFIVCC